MTKLEVMKIMAMINANYPEWSNKQSQFDKEILTDLWFEGLQEFDGSLVANVVKGMIFGDTTPYPPKIALVREKVINTLLPDMLTEQEAWNMVRRACDNTYRAKSSWENFPKEIQELCSPSDIRIWGLDTDLKDLDTVVASNFMRSYKAKAIKLREERLQPSSVKIQISEITKSLKLENKDDEGDDEDE
jgi:hypothetical protein